MLSTLALTAAHAAPFWGAPWLFFLIPLFWIGIIILIISLVGRRHRRYWGQYGHGPGGMGPWGGSSVASAESVLSERYARGDIDEKEYRARLEVLRATAIPRPGGPTK